MIKATKKSNHSTQNIATRLLLSKSGNKINFKSIYLVTRHCPLQITQLFQKQAKENKDLFESPLFKKSPLVEFMFCQ